MELNVCLETPDDEGINQKEEIEMILKKWGEEIKGTDKTSVPFYNTTVLTSNGVKAFVELI